MPEIVRWLVLGFLLGFLVEWVWDYSVWKKSAPRATAAGEVDDLRDEVDRLSRLLKASEARQEEHALHAQQLLDVIAERDGIRRDLAALESRLVSVAVGAPVPSASVESASPLQAPAGLEAIDGLTADQIELLKAAGVTSLGDLAATTPDTVLAALDAQPWDMIDPEPWIAQARSMVGGVGSPAPRDESQIPDVDDLSTLPGITPEQVKQLEAAGLHSFAEISLKSADDLLTAVEAQPWDMVDVDAWISHAREHV